MDACEDYQNPGLCNAYKITLALSILALFVNLGICVYIFIHNYASSITPHYRSIIFVDVLQCTGHLMDSFTALINFPGTNQATIDGHSHIFFGFVDTHTVRINDCAVYKPFVFLILFSRQWMGMIAVGIGFERLLYIVYPIWFRSVKLKQMPTIMFQLAFCIASCVIAYVHTLFISPNEITYYSCETTWAFGENYGWASSSMMLLQILVGWSMAMYTFAFFFRSSALSKFGNQRIKFDSERRRIRKVMWLLTTTLIFYGLPVIIILIMRIKNHFEYATFRQLVASFTLLKCFTNIPMHFVLNDAVALLVHSVRSLLSIRHKRRVEPHDLSIYSVSGAFVTN